MAFSPALWLDFSDASTLFTEVGGSTNVAAGGTIAQVNDKSGNGRHAIQATSGNRPTRQVGVIGGRDVCRYDGSANYMDVTANDSWAPTGEATFFSVTKSTKTSMTQPTYQCIFMYGTAATGRSVISNYSDDPNSGNDAIAMSQYGNAMGLPNRLNQWNLQSVYKPSTTGTWSQLVNGSNLVQKSMTTGTVLGSQFRIGAFNSALGLRSYLDGYIAEILVYPTALTTDQRQRVEKYLNEKYSIY